MSETVKQRVYNKEKWGPGEWQKEPDRIDWVSDGLACFILRNDYGVWCGYVGVPQSHKYYGKSYSDIDLAVHGGLTYADKCQGSICHAPKPGMPTDVWWFGFDCGHSYDISPLMEEMYKSLGVAFKTPFLKTYRNVKYAMAETGKLAKQLAEIGA